MQRFLNRTILLSESLDILGYNLLGPYFSATYALFFLVQKGSDTHYALIERRFFLDFASESHR